MGKIRVLKASRKLKDKEVSPKSKGVDIFWKKIQGTLKVRFRFRSITGLWIDLERILKSYWCFAWKTKQAPSGETLSSKKIFIAKTFTILKLSFLNLKPNKIEPDGTKEILLLQCYRAFYLALKMSPRNHYSYRQLWDRVRGLLSIWGSVLEQSNQTPPDVQQKCIQKL